MLNKCYGCVYYQSKTFYCGFYLRGIETAIYLCPNYRSENEEMHEVANRDAFYGESLNDYCNCPKMERLEDTK